jgi:hypothetical protein
MTPAARGATSSARLPEREVHVDGEGDAAAISTHGLCDRLFAFCHVFFWGPLISNCLCATFCSNLNLSSMKATYNT